MIACATKCERRIATACPYPSTAEAQRRCGRFVLMATVTTAVISKTHAPVRRERPLDGGLVWREDLHAFECYGCGDFDEVHNRRDREPDRLEELKELLILDHTECWEFDDPEMAKDARQHRKEKKRRELLKQEIGDREQGIGLAAQRVSWRGR